MTEITEMNNAQSIDKQVEDDISAAVFALIGVVIGFDPIDHDSFDLIVSRLTHKDGIAVYFGFVMIIVIMRYRDHVGWFIYRCVLNPAVKTTRLIRIGNDPDTAIRCQQEGCVSEEFNLHYDLLPEKIDATDWNGFRRIRSINPNNFMLIFIKNQIVRKARHSDVAVPFMAHIGKVISQYFAR